MRARVQRNFIRQQGFSEPAAMSCPVQYSALMLQPRLVMVWVLAGILFQSPRVFEALCAVLWWSALLPQLNPFDALHNAIRGRRPGATRLGPAPAPRRFAQTIAGVFALATALLLHAGCRAAAYAVEGIFLAAVLALALGGFCLGSFVYQVVSGRVAFARQTLPWAR